MTMNLPAGVVQSGANTINFRFNQTDGRVSGFRVLAFKFKPPMEPSSSPTRLLSTTIPIRWQPPSTAASDIAAGQTLWRTAALTIPVSPRAGPQPILAHCTDCHAQDGRDLKYFNYSNNSIQTRAVVPWADSAAGQSDRQLHSHIERGESRPAVESALSAWPWIGFAAGQQLGGRRRPERGGQTPMRTWSMRYSRRDFRLGFRRDLAPEPARDSSAGAAAGLEPVAAGNSSHGCIRRGVYHQRLQHHLSNSQFQSSGKQSGGVCSAAG